MGPNIGQGARPQPTSSNSKKMAAAPASACPAIQLAAARAIAEHLRNPTVDNVIPPTLDEQVAWRVADEVRRVAQEEFGVRED